MKSYGRQVCAATAMLVVLASMAPGCDAKSFRGLRVHDEENGGWAAKELNGDAFFRHGALLDGAERDEEGSLDVDPAIREDAESLDDLDYDHREVDTGSDEDNVDRDDDNDSSDGSVGEEDEDVNEKSALEGSEDDGDDAVGLDAVSDFTDPGEARGNAGSIKQQTLPTPSPSIPATTRPIVTTPAPPPIGESAAAAKDITSIDKSAIQRDPASYGDVTTAPPASATSPAPPLIGESAAAAKDITSIDKSAIQRDPTSYGVVTTAPLNESPAAAHPVTPTTSSSAPAENNPKQVGV